jgi:ribosomal protein S12 methylthiotransferase accessory factor
LRPSHLAVPMRNLVYYQLAAGVDVVPLTEESVLFRSNTLAVKVEGSMAALLSRSVLPLLNRPRSLDDLESQLGDLADGSLKQSLDSLVEARVLERSTEATTLRPDRPFAAFISNLGVEPGEAADRLRALRVGIFGLEAHGAHLALELARLGVGACILADPFITEESDALLMPAGTFRPGFTRQESVAEAIGSLAPSMSVTLGAELSRDSVLGIAENSNLLVGCFDRGYETAHHWINRAAVATGTPAMFAEISTHVATIGPCVLPGQAACYMCYRMRRMACEQNYDEAMAYERFLNQRNQPSLSSRATAPFLSAHVASLLVGEIVKLVALLLPASLAGRIMEFDALTLESRFHAVLRQPDCPVCGAEKKKDRNNATLTELLAAEQSDPSGDLRVLSERLVSPRTGVVRRFEPFVKDPVEPAAPYIVRADIANHSFVSKRDDDGDICSGKGLTLSDARVSALGEAVERYSGAVHSSEEVRYARRSELDIASLDPRELVLYHSSQYSELPYAPYNDNRLGWIPARSLVSGDEVLVPALAVFMNYRAHADGEFIFPITSNGLATGCTLLEAVWNAAGEVLERDAFMIAWLNHLPAQRLSARVHPDSQIVELAESYLRRQVEIRLYRLPTDHDCAVFAGIALEAPGRGGPAAVIGLGADPDPVLASRKAVLEVCQVRPALRRRLRNPEAQTRLRELLDDPRLVATIDDHDLLYASQQALPRLGFWLDVNEEPFAWTCRATVPSAQNLANLVAWLGTNGHDLLYVNLTPPDMAELGLYTARAILPGFQPIDFGWKERRLGGTRIYSQPFALGLRQQPSNWENLNHDPHPLA